MAEYQFETEVNKLLHLIIHSLYSNKDIFLRELISNASDALDKLKYLNISDEKYKALQFVPRIDIVFDEPNAKLIVRDTGLGMNEEDLKANLGTIAKSGTKAFLDNLSDGAKKDSSLIGQFGVGFYSAFMVAEKIEVISKKATENEVYKWTSDGKGSYQIEKVDDSSFPLIDGVEEGSFGTAIILQLNAEDSEYATRWRIEQIIKKYSNHVAFPIYLHYLDKEYGDKGEVKSETAKTEQINDTGAIWQRQKSELKEEDYNSFYKSISQDYEDPLFYIHTKAEGTQEYATLFYIPKKAPFDMYHADYKPGVKLFVKRVFITDDDKELLPTYLRFVRGVIDSEDLPLNVSREILQQNKILANIRNASVNKLLAEFKRLSEEDKEKYSSFINEFNRALKEGLYGDFEHKEELAELVRFKSTYKGAHEDAKGKEDDSKEGSKDEEKDSSKQEWVSFADYVSRMKADQKAIYYITGEDEKTCRESPHLESYKAKGIEVLIMADDIDDIVIPMLGKYKDFELKAANRLGSDDELATEEEKEKAKAKEEEMKPLLEKVKEALGDDIKEVRFSKRLFDSPSCIVVDEKDPSLQMERMMKAMGRQDYEGAKPILEINGEHAILKAINASNDKEFISDASHVLLSQALLAEKRELKEPMDFIRRLNRLVEKGL